MPFHDRYTQRIFKRILISIITQDDLLHLDQARDAGGRRPESVQHPQPHFQVRHPLRELQDPAADHPKSRNLLLQALRHQSLDIPRLLRPEVLRIEPVLQRVGIPRRPPRLLPAFSSTSQ